MEKLGSDGLIRAETFLSIEIDFTNKEAQEQTPAVETKPAIWLPLH